MVARALMVVRQVVKSSNKIGVLPSGSDMDTDAVRRQVRHLALPGVAVADLSVAVGLLPS